MSNLFKKVSSVVVIATVAFALGACQTKKKSEDQGADGMGGAPGIDSQAMSFDASGSDSGNIAGLASINFDYDKSTLSSTARKTLQGNAEWMKGNPNVNIQIEGHCDSRGSIEYNLSLGERRAQSVKSYLVSLGVPAARLSIISYGKEKPLVSGDTEAAMAANRRANFLPLQ